MSVRINLEIGHEASIRTKRTHEGFTHDWKVFVKGCDHAQIQYYVEKIVFHLHETFPKPKRVVKEPPYSLKESGYAGFALPIDIYLKNKDEPKKITFNYDLNLQPAGPPILKVQKERYIFNVTNEDFKSKLLKGGGVLVSNSQQELIRDSRPVQQDEKSGQLVSKPRLGGSDFVKKHKPKLEDGRMSSFQALFGPPLMKNSIVTVDSKSQIPSTATITKDKNSNLNNKSGSSSAEKEKSKSKHNQHKDKEKEKDKEKLKEKTDLDKKSSKEEKRRDEKKEHKEREKKEKREKSPKPRSPTPTKRPPSPKRLPSPLPPAKYKDKEEKKSETSREKRSSEDKEKEKLEKKLKKEKRDKERERNKESKHKEKESQKSNEQQKESKNVMNEKEKHKESVREQEASPSPTKSEKKEKLAKEKETSKEYSSVKDSKEMDYVHKNGKTKGDKPEDKPKHKHKKKDKERKERDKNGEKEKSHKSEKKIEKASASVAVKFENIDESITQKENEKDSLFNSPKTSTTPEIKNEKLKKPLNQLFAECGDSDTSNTSLSSNENSFTEPPKKEPTFELPIKPEKQKVKKEKTKKSKEKKSEKKDSEKKRKRKIEVDHPEEPLEKVVKEEPLKDSDAELNSTPIEMALKNTEYRNLLKELRLKILAVKNNNELQKIAEIIASSGKFRISAHTIDFDLTSLEQITVTRLQNYFDNS